MATHAKKDALQPRCANPLKRPSMVVQRFLRAARDVPGVVVRFAAPRPCRFSYSMMRSRCSRRSSSFPRRDLTTRFFKCAPTLQGGIPRVNFGDCPQSGGLPGMRRPESAPGFAHRSDKHAEPPRRRSGCPCIRHDSISCDVSVQRLVRKKGFEPSRPCGHKLLRLARLPVPPLPHEGGSTTGLNFRVYRVRV